MTWREVATWLSSLDIGQFLLGGGFTGAAVAIIKMLIRNKVPMTKIKIGADEKLRENLLQRVEKLENDNDNMRKDHEKKISDLIASHQLQINNLVSANATREAIMRHELQNTRTCFTALLFMLKRMPNKPATLDDIINDIENMRAEQIKGEDIERTVPHIDNNFKPPTLQDHPA